MVILKSIRVELCYFRYLINRTLRTVICCIETLGDYMCYSHNRSELQRFQRIKILKIRIFDVRTIKSCRVLLRS